MTDGEVTFRLAKEGQPEIRRGPVPSHTVSVVFDADLNEWRRGWGAAKPTREAVISVGDPIRSRSAAGSTQLFPAHDLAYTVLGEPDDIDPVIEAVEQYLSREDETRPTVFVDDVFHILGSFGSGALRTFLEELARGVEAAGDELVVGCSPTAELVHAIDSLTPVIDEVTGIDREVTEAVERLRSEDPTTFGYTRRHWSEAGRGIDACTRNYPQAKQIHAALETPETTPRTLGATLTGLVELGVLGTWGETVGPTRYDLTAYDPIEAARVGFVLASCSEAEAPRLVHDD